MLTIVTLNIVVDTVDTAQATAKQVHESLCKAIHEGDIDAQDWLASAVHSVNEVSYSTCEGDDDHSWKDVLNDVLAGRKTL